METPNWIKDKELETDWYNDWYIAGFTNLIVEDSIAIKIVDDEDKEPEDDTSNR